MNEQDKLTHLSDTNRALVKEWLDFAANDSENLERALRSMTDDCVWVIEPGGTEYRGLEELKAFVGTAMSGRTHDKGEHKIEITNWFADNNNFCYEYRHGGMSTGVYTAGIKGSVKTGVLRYCITCHMRDGKVDEIHEYINSTSWWMAIILQFMVSRIHRLTNKKIIDL